jgi:hypothetical protein
MAVIINNKTQSWCFFLSIEKAKLVITLHASFSRLAKGWKIFIQGISHEEGGGS